MPLSTYTSVMAHEDTLLEEAMDNLKEAPLVRAAMCLDKSLQGER